MGSTGKFYISGRSILYNVNMKDFRILTRGDVFCLLNKRLFDSHPHACSIKRLSIATMIKRGEGKRTFFIEVIYLHEWRLQSYMYVQGEFFFVTKTCFSISLK